MAMHLLVSCHCLPPSHKILVTHSEDGSGNMFKAGDFVAVELTCEAIGRSKSSTTIIYMAEVCFYSV